MKICTITKLISRLVPGQSGR